MAKYFNATGVCRPQEHYMVNLDQRLAEIRKMIDRKNCFSINRGRQFGKTTTLAALKTFLQKDFIVISLDFQFLTQADFQDECAFSSAFARRFAMALRNVPEAEGASLDRIRRCADESGSTLGNLFEYLSDFCAAMPKPVVMLIDEVDSASDNQVFLDFLALLRGYYLQREEFPTFQSVILAGVYDIRNLKQKLRPESEHKRNSPWNIAAEFDVNMDLEPDGIRGMLAEYEGDWHTGMDIAKMAELLYDETCGYPFLVSRLCQLMDEKLPGSPEFPDKNAVWSREGLLAAEKLLLMEKNPLFDSLINKLTDYQELRELLYSILFLGERIVYNPDNAAIDIAGMFGFVKNKNGTLQVANRIFETRLYNLFLSEEELSNKTFSFSCCI